MLKYPRTLKEFNVTGFYRVRIKSSGAEEIAYIAGDKFCIVESGPPWKYNPNWDYLEAVEILQLHSSIV